MLDQLRLLTCKAKGLSHQPTEVSINWGGISDEQMKTLARHAIIHALQTSWKKSDQPIPENCCVNAVEFVKEAKHEILEDRPPVPQMRPKIDWLDKLVQSLSPAEKEKYLRELQA